jgi:8-oxo-dGTP pyrophosphatase MutT (NUDIX family)
MTRFDAVRAALAGHRPRTFAHQGLRPAAVLLPLYERNGEETLLFTRRTDNLEHHRGEISFPGGARHPEDPDLETTALRETEEEMGIAAADVELLGRLDDCYSVHGYHVVPFVGVFPWPYPFRINRDEIAAVIEVPVAALRDPAIFSTEDWQHRGRTHPVHFYRYGDHAIWGLTAAMLKQFLELTG